MNTKKILLSGTATFLAIGGLALSRVNAAEVPDAGTGDTNVTYTNLNGAEGDSGLWMVTFPSAIQFTDTTTTQALPLELIGMNGYTLDQLNPDLKVNVYAESANAYLLKNTDTTISETAEYSVTYPTASTKVKVATLDPKTHTKEAATGTLTKKATVKGTYTDTITYTLTHEGNEL